ncbi:2-hydroxyacid dehydrogenase [Microbacterium sp. 22303]|uniref:2-hydroxyacid dehydrogenase n=1 Tax=Microbacterium sp. 22303 TaxID=3453905 RepID=UPI003F833810
MTEMNALTVSVPTTELAHDLRGLPERVRVLGWNFDGDPPVPHVDIVVLPYLSSLEPLHALGRVSSRLVQSPALGFDGIEARLVPGITFANGVAVHETSTAEMALALVLASQRDLPRMLVDQTRGHWPQRDIFVPGLADRRVLLIGYGGVGRSIAHRLRAFEADTSVVASRSYCADDGTEIHAVDELPRLLATTEIVIVAVPLTRRTERLIDGDFLARLPDGALVVNVSRGRIVDTGAMLREAGRLRFALDVTDPEPLPLSHPLWYAPGVIITPHAAAGTMAMRPRIAGLVTRQIERMLAGEEPLNVVIRT